MPAPASLPREAVCVPRLQNALQEHAMPSRMPRSRGCAFAPEDIGKAVGGEPIASRLRTQALPYPLYTGRGLSPSRTRLLLWRHHKNCFFIQYLKSIAREAVAPEKAYQVPGAGRQSVKHPDHFAPTSAPPDDDGALISLTAHRSRLPVASIAANRGRPRPLRVRKDRCPRRSPCRRPLSSSGRSHRRTRSARTARR